MRVLTIDLPEYEGLYSGCSNGKVWSHERITYSGKGYKIKRTYGGHYLSPSSCGNSGYEIVTLCKEGKLKYKTVHSIIAECFHGTRPDGLVINHIDGDKYNNKPENLEYITDLENKQHAVDIGLVNNKGQNNPNYKHGKYVGERSSRRKTSKTRGGM